MKKLTLISIILVIALFAVNIYFYNFLPDTIITHWGGSGQANGTMNKFLGLFLFPLLTLGMLLLFIFLPRLDPMKENYKKFQTAYNSFVVMFILFMFYINFLVIFWNLGFQINMTKAVIPAIGFLFIFIGIIIRYVKRNWFMGIRTPWTLSSDKVWDKTHRFGGVLFVISGIITIIGIFFPEKYMVWFILIPIIASVIWMYVYSYLVYRKEKKK